MGGEAVEGTAFEQAFPPLRVLPQPPSFEVVTAPVHETVGNISQPQTVLEKMLLRYKGNLQDFYSKNGNPQSLEDKIRILESKIGQCRVACKTREEILQNLEFDYLDKNRLLTGPDSSDYFV